jgi:hypothetical protein
MISINNGPTPSVPQPDRKLQEVLLEQNTHPTSASSYDHTLPRPVDATAPDGTRRRATLTERIHSEHGETRYYVNSVALPQSIKTEAAARVEVSRLISQGQLVGLPLSNTLSKPAERMRLTSLPGNAGIVEVVQSGNRMVVEIRAREELHHGCWRAAGYVATKVSTYAVESRGHRTPVGQPTSSKTMGSVIRDRSGGVITDVAQARQRCRELAAHAGLGLSSAAQTGHVHRPSLRLTEE